MSRKPNTSELLPFDDYDCVIVAFSAGKDSLASALHMLDIGVPGEKIELWHHHIDGAPGSESFMDWPITPGYCQAVANHLNINLRASWKEGGFLGEMHRQDSLTRPISFESTDGQIVSLGGERGKKSTRLLFPQVSADLSVRWCSAYLKVDVARRVLSNDPKFKKGKFLFITGERRQESTSRAKYAEIERHTCTTRDRRVDHWRPIIDWRESDVWEIIKRWKIRPHPGYILGWGRLSCMFCIFGDANQWATGRAINTKGFDRVADEEIKSGKTIQRGASIIELANKGKIMIQPGDGEIIALAMQKVYPQELIVDSDWQIPRGAFKVCAGPT